MTQELEPEPRAFACTFDQTRNIGDHKTLFCSHAHHAQMRVQGREGIVRNLRTGVGNGRNEGGLTGVGHSEKPHVRQDFEFQLQFAVFAFFAGSRLTRRPIRTRLKVQVPQAAAAALGEQLLVAVMRQIRHRHAGRHIHDLSPHGHPKHHIVAARAEAVRTAAVFAVGRKEFLREAIVHERIDVLIGYRINAAAATAVATVGTALRNEFFPAKARSAVAAFTGLHFNAGLVDKFHLSYSSARTISFRKTTSLFRMLKLKILI